MEAEEFTVPPQIQPFQIGKVVGFKGLERVVGEVEGTDHGGLAIYIFALLMQLEVLHVEPLHLHLLEVIQSLPVGRCICFQFAQCVTEIVHLLRQILVVHTQALNVFCALAEVVLAGDVQPLHRTTSTISTTIVIVTASAYIEHQISLHLRLRDSTFSRVHSFISMRTEFMDSLLSSVSREYFDAFKSEVIIRVSVALVAFC